MELADRTEPVYPAGSPQVHSLIPLQEIVAELLDCGPATKKAVEGYVRLINAFGSEFGLLLDTPVEAIRAKGFTLLAEAIDRVRGNRVIRRAGYDGEFGVITVFSEGERASLCGQGSLFGPVAGKARQKNKGRNRLDSPGSSTTLPVTPTIKGLNSEQQRVVASEAPLILVQAGPGTGKTHTLVSRVQRIASLAPLPCTVITFTNKAAAEVRERLQAASASGSPVTVATFHGYCLTQLRRLQPDLGVAGPEERAAILTELYPDWKEQERVAFSRQLSLLVRQPHNPAFSTEASRYLQTLAERSLIDIEAVVPRTVELLRRGGEAAATVRTATGHLFVDEFQDVNEAQYTLVTLLAETSTVFVIGDPDQAIYGFRGSDPKWFHTFIRELQPEVHQLVRNYRSGTTILRAAEQLIGHNPHPLPVAAMQPCAALPGKMHRQECANPEREAAFIADQIELQLGGTSHRSWTGSITPEQAPFPSAISAFFTGPPARLRPSARCSPNVASPFSWLISRPFTPRVIAACSILGCCCSPDWQKPVTSCFSWAGSRESAIIPCGRCSHNCIDPPMEAARCCLTRLHWKAPPARPLNDFVLCMRGCGHLPKSNRWKRFYAPSSTLTGLIPRMPNWCACVTWP